MKQLKASIYLVILALLDKEVVMGHNTTSTLKLLHVLFRHGNRNPEYDSIWEGNPYTDESFYPEGFAQLTNAGKETAYQMGLFLRQSYGEFLGETWNINTLDVRTTDYNRTKMSAMLMLAGLYPPKCEDNWSGEEGFPWQPIPYNYWPLENDTLLNSLLILESPTFCKEFLALLNSTEISTYLSGKYGAAMAILNRYTGIPFTDYRVALKYADTMKIQTELGYKLPDWCSQVYPKPLTDLTSDFYYIYTNTTVLRRQFAGQLVNKILQDSDSVANGSLSPSTRKMFVYSAHDFNVGTMVLSLDAYQMSRPPPYGSIVIFEVHEIDEVYGLQLYYQDYSTRKPHALNIPGCNHFCPLTKFRSLVQDILPV
ncbi:venom acid phosphatase Acph-1-like [Euwallacea fornicatus]|uniref:venom acid phosphatase Acph-1-like n=1 Tax=Euwallacea fornicatus TaxID=995702 RepID=UPI00338FCA33